MSALQADHDQIERFVNVLFRYADEGTYASLRAFDQTDRSKPPFMTMGIAINGNMAPLVEAGAMAAQRCADHHRAIVFAPPIATFSNPDHARGEDLANGLVLSVEIDDADPKAARTRLEGLLGPVTMVVESGSFWTDPATGELKPKVHLHWRLSEPTVDGEGHERLKQARKHAALLVGADPTGSPVVHPLRWPGSWNCKGKPQLAKITICNETAEIHLDAALERLTEAVEAAGLEQAGIPHGPSGPPEARIELVQNAMQAIPNPGAEIHYDDWIRLGYATYRATCGSEDGFKIWDEWSSKSEKYNAIETVAAWRRIKHAIDGSNAPRTIGAGTIFFHAGKTGWTRPKPQNNGTDGEAKPEPNANGTADQDAVPLPQRFSENALAYLFTAEHPDLIYVHEWGKWLRYDAGRWHEDHAVTVFDAARTICAREGKIALATILRGGTAVAATINKASTVSAIERLARHHHKHVRAAALFDADRTMLNSPDDTLNIGEEEHATA